MMELKKHKYDFEIDVTQKNDARVIAFDFIEPNSKVLDIGSSSGCFGQILKKYKNCEITGIEYDFDSIKIAEEKKVFEKIYQLDLNNFDIKQFGQYKNYFDYIVFGDVLEHLLFPNKVLEAFKFLLKPNGKYIISLPNTAHATVKINLLVNKFEYEEIGILDKTHIKFFTHKTLPSFLAESKLAMEKFDYTIMPVKRHNSENNLSAIPIGVRNFIFKDNYSYVLQYIILCSLSEKPQEELLKTNKIALHKKNIKKELLKTKISCYRKYIFFYFIKQIRNLFKKHE